MHIWPESVLEQIQQGSEGWWASVPEPVAEQIAARGMFSSRWP
jgi:hypothetical protein